MSGKTFRVEEEKQADVFPNYQKDRQPDKKWICRWCDERLRFRRWFSF
jgi:hypothetical protein